MIEETQGTNEMIAKAFEESGNEEFQEENESNTLLVQARQQAEAFRCKMEDANAKIVELESKLAVLTGEKIESGSSELKVQLDKFLNEHAELLASQPELHQIIKQLQMENEQYRHQSNITRIKESLFEEAKRLGIRPEAMRDVERLSSELTINESGKIVTKTGRTVHELLESEKSLSPHWFPASQGGGSFPGGTETKSNDLFDMARRQHDLRAMIANAPLID